MLHLWLARQQWCGGDAVCERRRHQASSAVSTVAVALLAHACVVRASAPRESHAVPAAVGRDDGALSHVTAAVSWSGDEQGISLATAGGWWQSGTMYDDWMENGARGMQAPTCLPLQLS